MTPATAARDRARGDIVRLVQHGLGVHELARAVTLVTGEIAANALPAAARTRLLEIELLEPDFNKFTALARADRPAASLSDATAGDLDRSLRQRDLRRPSGFGDELRAVLAGPMGGWVALTLLRKAKRPQFTAAEVRFVASLAGPLADGLRRAALLGDAVGGGHDHGAGLLILAADDSVESANRAAEHWLDELGARSAAHLPVVARAVANRTRRIATGDHPVDGPARARVRTPAGSWLVVEGSLLRDGHGSRVAVLLHAARPPKLAPLIADAYGLTRRERLVTELVAQGFSTTDIGARLHLSAYTVQDHLKAIFEKSGTGSRGDLVARLFFDHYAPRLTEATVESRKWSF